MVAIWTGEFFIYFVFGLVMTQEANFTCIAIITQVAFKGFLMQIQMD